MKRLSLKTLTYGLLTVLLLGLLAWAALREPAQLVRVQPVQQGPITQSFSEEGKTRVRARYVIAAPVAGQLQRIALEPGEPVLAGQVLAEIAPATSGLLDARSRAQAQAEVRAGQSQQAAAQRRIQAAEAAQALAQSTLQRTQTLRTQGMVSAAQLDQAQTQAAAAAAELAAARAEEQAVAQRVVAARAVLAQEGSAADSARPLAVTAPAAGVVLRRLLQSATPVAAGQALLEIGDPTQLEIEAEVLSTDAVRLQPGMTARVQRWGGEGTLEARISRIEPGGFTKVSALGVEEQRTRVILELTSPQAQWAGLGDAYRVELEFILQHEANVLQVPAGALFRSGTTAAGAPEQWALYRVEGDRARRTVVEVGLRSATAAQILSGVREGDAVIVQPDDRIREGSRVEAH